VGNGEVAVEDYDPRFDVFYDGQECAAVHRTIPRSVMAHPIPIYDGCKGSGLVRLSVSVRINSALLSEITFSQVSALSSRYA
jgi:hypothetical protein